MGIYLLTCLDFRARPTKLPFFEHAARFEGSLHLFCLSRRLEDQRSFGQNSWLSRLVWRFLFQFDADSSLQIQM